MSRWFKKSQSSKAALPGPLSLLKHSAITYKQNLWILISITAIVAVPYSILGLITGDTNTNVLAAYGSFAALVMNLALIWAVTQLPRRQPLRAKTAYHDGTAATVKFILVTLTLILQLTPFALGALLFSRATIGTTAAVTPPEFMLVGLLWAVLALPSLYWINRYCFSIFSITEPSITPLQALRASRRAVKGRAFKVFGRLAAVAVILVLATLLPTVGILLWLPISLTAYGLAALQILISVTFLPILYLYLHKLYLALA